MAINGFVSKIVFFLAVLKLHCSTSETNSPIIYDVPVECQGVLNTWTISFTMLLAKKKEWIDLWVPKTFLFIRIRVVEFLPKSYFWP